MSEDGEFCRELREAQQERRRKRLPIRTDAIRSLAAEGFRIEEKTPYQFRIEGVLDVYPIHNRYHDLKRNRRGGYRDVREFIHRFFNRNVVQ